MTASKTMFVTYSGPSDAVEIQGCGVIAPRGEPVEVPREIGESLLMQETFSEATRDAAAGKSDK